MVKSKDGTVEDFMSKTDSRNESKLIRELRKENIKLKRELKQLRKINNRTEVEMEEFRSVIEIEVAEPPKKKKKDECPKCKSFDLHIFKLRGKDYYHCSECGSKGRYI